MLEQHQSTHSLEDHDQNEGKQLNLHEHNNNIIIMHIACSRGIKLHNQSASNWGARDAWSNAPQLLADNYFVGS